MEYIFASINLISIFSLLPESKKSIVATAALDDDNGKLGKKHYI